MRSDFSEKRHVRLDQGPWEPALVADAHGRIETRGDNDVDGLRVHHHRPDRGSRGLDDPLRQGHGRLLLLLLVVVVG